MSTKLVLDFMSGQRSRGGPMERHGRIMISGFCAQNSSSVSKKYCKQVFQ